MDIFSDEWMLAGNQPCSDRYRYLRPWGADGFLPDSADNVEYDANAMKRVAKMKKTSV